MTNPSFVPRDGKYVPLVKMGDDLVLDHTQSRAFTVGQPSIKEKAFEGTPSIEALLNEDNLEFGDDTVVSLADFIFFYCTPEDSRVPDNRHPYYSAGMNYLLEEDPGTYEGLYTPLDLSYPSTVADLALFRWVSAGKPVRPESVRKISSVARAGLRIVTIEDTSCPSIPRNPIDFRLTQYIGNTRSYTSWVSDIVRGRTGLPFPYALAIAEYLDSDGDTPADFLQLFYHQLTIRNLRSE